MFYDREPSNVEVEVAELLVATADDADDLVDKRVPPVLKVLRERMHMDVVFVSQFRDGQRVFTHVEQTSPTLTVGASDPLEDSWCQRVVDGRIPGYIQDAAPYIRAGKVPPPGIPIGTHISTPIVLAGGQVYGTLCCFSATVNAHSTADDLKKLQYTARLVAWKMDKESGAAHVQAPV